ncbi:MAG: DUF5047 domain-containing protein [Acidimicrobiales bacterium]
MTATFPELVTGSHTVIYEARVLETFQTGADPTGEIVDLVDGDVTLDGTADIRGTCDLRVVGIFGQDGPSAFPRAQDRLFAPYGNEMFIRYGIDLGAEVLYQPLGYYRITTTEQGDATTTPLRLQCHDRMATIIDSKLVDPRAYAQGVTVGEVYDDLVLEIYPDATIEFDDASDTSELGRQLVVEQNRYQALRDLADGLGKIVYWNDSGVLRIETAPDPDVIVWEVRSGHGGVLVNARRQITRVGIFNAVVVTGEGGDQTNPVRAVAIDADPNSPTRFGGPIGSIPTFLSTPFVTTTAQAQAAAVQLLRTAIGAPFDMDFDAITNPSLRPFQAVRVTYDDGNRDIQLIDAVTISLDENASMSAKTRQKALILIGEP